MFFFLTICQCFDASDCQQRALAPADVIAVSVPAGGTTTRPTGRGTTAGRATGFRRPTCSPGDSEFCCGSGGGPSVRETIAALLYRQPRQMISEYIQNIEGFDLHDAYLRGFKAGMYKALGQRNADEWLSGLPGYS